VFTYLENASHGHTSVKAAASVTSRSFRINMFFLHNVETEGDCLVGVRDLGSVSFSSKDS